MFLFYHLGQLIPLYLLYNIRPYFVCTTQNNYFQMYAIADFVDYYRWKKVIAIYVDDDNGRNGVSVLGDAMSRKRAKISYKAVFPLGATESDISDLLNEVNLVESRVYVLHASQEGVYKRLMASTPKRRETLWLLKQVPQLRLRVKSGLGPPSSVNVLISNLQTSLRSL
ncbi:Glutamate receptor 3.5 [Glycine soja]